MRAGGGRTKGNAFENAVAKTIVAAFSHLGVTRKDCFRTPSSGGHKYAKQEDPGDLVISKKLRKIGFNFHVECKHWAKIELYWLMNHNKGKQFNLWLKQVTTASTKTGQEPMLIFKGNGRTPVMAMFPQCGIRTVPRMTVRHKGKLWFVTTLDNLLEELTHADSDS